MQSSQLDLPINNKKQSKKYKNQRWANLTDFGISPVFFLKKLLK
jgi:hypothetical protein